MASPITLVSDQKVAVGVTVLDKGGEAYAALPPGLVVTFESSNPSVVGVAIRPDGLNADLSSDDIGTSTVTVRAVMNGADLVGSPDSLEVTVINAEPGSMNLTVGAPEPE